MRVRKCDRCNKVYETYLGKDGHTFNTIGTNAYDIDNDRMFAGNEYDLCPTCQQEFVEWFNAVDGKLIGTPKES